MQEKGRIQVRGFYFIEDITGKEITGKLLARVKELDNVEIF